MKHPTRTLVTCLIAAYLAAACQATNGSAPATPTSWTGFLEGSTLDVSAELGGRVTSIEVEEGDVAQAGQLLATLDDEFARLQIEIADARIAAAQAQLALLEAGARAEDLRRAEARVAHAQAALAAAEQSLADAQAIRANPQTLSIATTEAETRALAATFTYTATAKQAEAADLESRLWADIVQQLSDGVDVRLPTGVTLHFDTPQNRRVYAQSEWNRASTTAWQAWAGLDIAHANAVAAYATWQDLADQLANPIALDARVNQARAARDRAAANVTSAQAALQILREGTSPAQLQAARAALDQARAARAALTQDAQRYRLAAPSAGVVTRVAFRVGEVAPPATAIIRLSVAGNLKLRVFVPMTQLERLRVGDAVTLLVNELNNQPLRGTITHIAERAEFAGRQAQTDQDRNAQLVAVEVAVADADARVKAGMPASIVLGAPPAEGIHLPAWLNRAPTQTYAGTLEARQTRVAAEISARAQSVRVQRGSSVNAGDVLVELDDAAIQNALAEAEAAERVAQAQLDHVTEPTRAGARALAEAGVAQANAEWQAARTALADAERVLKTPQELLMQQHAWEGKVRAAQGEVKRAEATLNSLKNQLELAQADQSNIGKTRYQMLLRQGESAEAALSAARATAQGNARVLALYRALLANPLELLAAKNAAAQQVKLAEAAKQVAQAELDIATRGAQPEAVALAQAQLRAAQAQREMMRARARRYILTSPLAGTVVGKSVQPGETVRVGAALVTIADTRELELTLYVPIQQIGTLKTGQSVKVTLPSLPGKSFLGKVIYIAPEAEFKPANVYNAQERSEIVFAVRVTVPNAAGELKAGLPADVTWGD